MPTLRKTTHAGEMIKESHKYHTNIKYVLSNANLNLAVRTKLSICTHGCKGFNKEFIFTVDVSTIILPVLSRTMK